MENLLKINRRICGPNNKGYRLRSNQEIYEKLDNFEVAIKKGRLLLWSHGKNGH